MVAIPPKPPTNTSHTTTTNRRRHAEHDQHSHLKGTRRWPIQATTGGFATIDPRHAGDTPQRSAYGSNSPHRAQASPSQLSTRRNVGTESRHKPQPHQNQHQASPKHPQATPTHHEHPQASPKAAHKIFPSDPKQPQATPTHPTHTTHPPHPTHTKRRRGLSRGAPTRLTAGDMCYLMRVQTTT